MKPTTLMNFAAVHEVTDLPIDLCISHGHWDHYGSAAQFESIMISATDRSAVSAPQSAQMQAVIDAVPGRCARTTPDGFSFAHWSPPIISPTRLLGDGDFIDLGGRSLTVVASPGHTAGSVCYLDSSGAILFTGDTVFRGAIHLDLEGGDEVAYASTVEKLRRLDGYQTICPAHFAAPLPAILVREVAEHVRSWTDGGVQDNPDSFQIVRAASP